LFRILLLKFWRTMIPYEILLLRKNGKTRELLIINSLLFLVKSFSLLNLYFHIRLFPSIKTSPLKYSLLPLHLSKSICLITIFSFFNKDSTTYFFKDKYSKNYKSFFPSKKHPKGNFVVQKISNISKFPSHKKI